jgi:hypothetical protein
VAYGKPTVYGAKLFFIKNTDRRTIVWSEEAAANTGYEAGGYTNVWVLGQTTPAPLTAILGTNNGLYYFRQASIGVIRGVVSTDFTTSATHDSVSAAVGCPALDGVAEDGVGRLWFIDNRGQPWQLPVGGQPVPVGISMARDNLNSNYINDQYGYDDFQIHSLILVASTVRVFISRPSGGWPFGTVWFIYNTPTGHVALVLHGDTGEAIMWALPGTTSGMNQSTSLFSTVYSEWLPCYTTTAGFMYAGGYQGNMSGGDEFATMVTRVITAPLGTVADGEDLQFERAHLVVGGSSGSTISGTVACFTSRKQNTSAISAAQSWSLASDGGLFVRQKHLTVGLNQQGRWIRLMVAGNSSAPNGFTLDKIRVDAYPLSRVPNVP